MGGILVRNDSILLVKRAKKPFKGWWDIPEGFLELGEHPEIGLVREIKEETGYDVKPVKILGILMDKYGEGREDVLTIFYIAQIIGGEQKAGSDADDAKLFKKDHLPKNVAFRSGREALAVWQRETV